MSEGPSPFFLSLPAPQGEGLISSFQKKAWERFLEIGLPTGREEAYRASQLRLLYQKEVEGTAALSFDPVSLGHPKALFLSLEEAAVRFPFVVKDRLEKFLAAEKNPFALLSFALSKGAAFLYLPPGVTLEAPVHLVAKGGGLTCPYLLVTLGKNASLSLSLRRELSSLSFGVVDLTLDDGARLHFTEMEEGGEEGISFQAIRGDLKRDSLLEGLHFSKGGKIAFNHKKISLSGEGAEADVSGLWTLREALTSQIWIEMVHKEPNARSRQCFKGALFDRSYSSFHGEIYVHSKAQGTDAYQLNQNLLLGEDARAEARPNLQIFADDVKASHGSTAGGLNPDQVFYLKTRGLPEVVARELLIRAFLDDILTLHPDPTRRKEIAEWIGR